MPVVSASTRRSNGTEFASCIQSDGQTTEEEGRKEGGTDRRRRGQKGGDLGVAGAGAGGRRRC